MEYDFDKLTDPQQRHLCFAATSNNYQGHPAVMRKLLELGMVEREESILSGRFPVRIKSYFVPLHVHVQWVAWCAKKYDESTPGDREW